MMKKFYFLILVTITQSIFANSKQNSSDAILEIASQEIPPYYFEKKHNQMGGFFYEVINNVCIQAKIECRFKLYPFRRVLQYLSEGSVHICAPMAFSAEREKDMDFSEIVFSSGYQFFGKKEVIDSVVNFRLITGNVGVHSPSSTSSALKVAQKDFNLDIAIKEETDVEMAFDKLKKGRYDLVFMNKEISNIWAKKNNTKNNEFKSFNKYTYPIDYRIAFANKNLSSNQNKLLDKFKKELSIYLKSAHFRKLSDTL